MSSTLSEIQIGAGDFSHLETLNDSHSLLVNPTLTASAGGLLTFMACTHLPALPAHRHHPHCILIPGNAPMNITGSPEAPSFLFALSLASLSPFFMQFLPFYPPRPK